MVGHISSLPRKKYVSNAANCDWSISDPIAKNHYVLNVMARFVAMIFQNTKNVFVASALDRCIKRQKKGLSARAVIVIGGGIRKRSKMLLKPPKIFLGGFFTSFLDRDTYLRALSLHLRQRYCFGDRGRRYNRPLPKCRAEKFADLSDQR